MKVIFLILALSLTVFSEGRLLEMDRIQDGYRNSEGEEVLYLPKNEGIKAISFGYRNVLSNMLWFKTISYFGKHYADDQQYKWLMHMCLLVTDLDPEKKYVYNFCSMMLSWEAGKPEDALEILNKATGVFNDEYYFYYIRGMVYLYFLDNREAAVSDFTESASKRDAPAFIKRIAGKGILSIASPEAAAEFLQKAISNSADKIEREALMKRYRQILFEIGIGILTYAADIYRGKTGGDLNSIEDLDRDILLQAARKRYMERNGSRGRGYSDFLYPQMLYEDGHYGKPEERYLDPYGGHYYYNAETGEFMSTSKHKRLNRYKKLNSSVH